MRLSWFRNDNNSITVVARRAKFGTQVGCSRPITVLEFPLAVSNGERVARESLLCKIKIKIQSLLCFKSFRMFFFQILHSYNSDRASTEKTEDCSFLFNTRTGGGLKITPTGEGAYNTPPRSQLL